MHEWLFKTKNQLINPSFLHINNQIAQKDISFKLEFKHVPALFSAVNQPHPLFKPSLLIKVLIGENNVDIVIEHHLLNEIFEIGLGVPYSKLMSELNAGLLSWFSNFLTASASIVSNKTPITISSIETYAAKPREKIDWIFFECELAHKKFSIGMPIVTPSNILNYTTHWFESFPSKSASIEKKDIYITLGFNIGFTKLSLYDLLHLESGDLIFIDHAIENGIYITTKNNGIIIASIQKQSLVITSPLQFPTLIFQQSYASFKELAEQINNPQEIDRAVVIVRFEVKEKSTTLEELEKYKIGYQVTQMNALTSSQVSLCIMEKKFAAGEILNIKGKLAVQIQQFYT